MSINIKNFLCKVDRKVKLLGALCFCFFTITDAKADLQFGLPSIFLEGKLNQEQCPSRIWYFGNVVKLQHSLKGLPCDGRAYQSPIETFDVVRQKVGPVEVIRPTNLGAEAWSLWLYQRENETRIIYRTLEGKKFPLTIRFQKEGVSLAPTNPKANFLTEGTFCSADKESNPKITLQFLPQQKVIVSINSSHCVGDGPCTMDLTLSDWSAEFLLELKPVLVGTQTFFIPTSVKRTDGKTGGLGLEPSEQSMMFWKIWNQVFLETDWDEDPVLFVPCPNSK